MISPEFAYLLKVNLALVLFYAFYRLFCTRDTFFRWRRFTLAAFWMVAGLYPFMDFQNWVSGQASMQEAVSYVQTIHAETFVADAGTEYAGLSATSAAASPASTFSLSFSEVFTLFYLAGVAFLVMRFLVQLFVICRLSRRCRKIEYNGTQIRLLEKNSGPFSFFRWIFIHPNTLENAQETKEILAHELSHARGWHSVDILFSELCCIFCWMNPFSWLLKRETRNNLEYLADHQVLTAGHDTKAYQYHLLGLAHQKTAAPLYNHFNVLPIKKRITMMNKKRTKEIGRTKYFMFLPLAAILMLFSNIELVARSTETVYSKISETLSTIPSPLQNKTDSKVDKKEVIINDQKADSKADKKEVVITDKKTDSNADKTDSKPKKKADLNAEGILIAPKLPGKNTLIVLDGKVFSKKINFDLKTADNIKFAEFLGLELEEIGKVSIYRDEEAIKKHGEQAKEGLAIIESKSYMMAQGTYDDGCVFEVINYLSPSRISSNSIVTTQKFKENEPEKIYKYVHNCASFKGGEEAFFQYLSDNLKDVEVVKNKDDQRMAFLQFVVEKDGSINNIEVSGNTSSEIKKAAAKVLENMPAWEPATLEGNVVRYSFITSVNFNPSM